MSNWLFLGSQVECGSTKIYRMLRFRVSTTSRARAVGKTQDELVSEIQEIISRIRSYTPKVGIFGNSGVGKSSLCNALFGRQVAKVADVEACTREPQTIFVGKADGGGINLVDVPGIGENPARHREYVELYKSLAPNLDLVLWAIKADDRNYASALEGHAEVLKANKALPIIFVITQSDKTNDLDDWDHASYAPGGTQCENILRKESDVSRQFGVSTRDIISIAVSKKGKSYNLRSLVDLVVERLPNEKKFSFTRETKEENVSEDARKNAEKGIWDSIKDVMGEAWKTVQPFAIQMIVGSAPKLISSLKGWLSKSM